MYLPGEDALLVFSRAPDGWQNWVTISYPGIELEQGDHVFKLVMEGSEFNLNWIKFLKE